MKRVRERDQTCVYCRKALKEPQTGSTYRDWATIEHLNSLPPWDNPDSVAICCGECNSRRGKKELADWFNTPYCIEKNISEKTVADPVKKYLARSFIDRCEWTFAKTMPGVPHDYVVRDNLSEDDKKAFDTLADYIQKHGYAATFGTKNYIYADIKNYKYWTIDNILNRAKK